MQLDSIKTPHLAIYAGGVVIAGSTAYVIAKSGAILSPHSLLLVCLAFGIFAAAFVLGEGKTAGRTTIALVAALIAAESFNLLNNSERLVMSREAEQAPLREKAEAYEAAQRAVSDAKASKATSERLERADKALAEAKATRITQRFDAAQRAVTAAEDAVAYERQTGCRNACRDKQAIAAQLRAARQSAADADARDRVSLIAKAEAEVQAAATEAEAMKAERIATAEATLKATPLPVSATPLADRLNIDGGLLDIIAAVAMSVAVIGLGATLVAHGSGELAANKTISTFADPAIVPGSLPPASIFAGELPDPTPPQGPRGKRRLPANVLHFPARHPVIEAIERNGGTVASNQELAELMGVCAGEASKRWQEVADQIEVAKVGKRREFRLRA